MAIAASAPVERWAQHDADVLRAVVADLAADDELGRARSSARTILVDARTKKAGGLTISMQMEGEVRGRWPHVERLAQALYARNAEQADLDVVFDDPDVRVLDFSPFPRLLSDFRIARSSSEPPPHRLAVQLHRPVYSADGEVAFARVFFGPSAHGATATLLLRRSSSGWTVEWREFFYYA